MERKVKPVPQGYEGVIPYLCVRDAAGAIEFYKDVFSATEIMRLTDPGGMIGHAELRIGGMSIMLSEESPDMDMRGPQLLGGSPVSLVLYLEDVDAVASKAVAAGAKLLGAIEDQFYGDRTGKLEDPFGHIWMIATHIEDVSVEEIQKRFLSMFDRE
jgi:PhnB protein